MSQSPSPHVSSSAANPEKRSVRFAICSLFGLAIIVALLCSGMWIIRKHFVAYWEPVKSSSDWPYELKSLLKDVNQKQIKVGHVKVYDLKNRPDFFGPENVWRMESSPELLSLMVKSWKLSSIDKNSKWVERFLAKMREDWQCRDQTDDIEYFASEGRLIGNKSDLYVVMNDKTHKRIVVWYYFNF